MTDGREKLRLGALGLLGPLACVVVFALICSSSAKLARSPRGSGHSPPPPGAGDDEIEDEELSAQHQECEGDILATPALECDEQHH